MLRRCDIKRRRLWSLIIVVGVSGMLLAGVTGPLRQDIAASTGIHHVALGGDCGGETPCYATLQVAVDAAADGELVKIAAGTYDDLHDAHHGRGTYYSYTTTQVVIITKALTLRGGYIVSDWQTADPETYPTILDAREAGRGVYVAGQVTVTLEGLQIVNGRGGSGAYNEPPGGGGIAVDRDHEASLIVRQCTLTGNGGDDGGGLYVQGGALMLEDSRLVSNTSSGSGGGIYAREGAVTLTGNVFETNLADSGDGRGAGGGAWLYEATAYVADNIFQDNAVGDVGGGLQVGRGDLHLTGNTFLDNTTSDHGGGLYADLSSGHAYTITPNLFQGNVANVSGSGTGGGARLFGAEGAQLIFRHNEVVGNYACTGRTGANGGL